MSVADAIVTALQGTSTSNFNDSLATIIGMIPMAMRLGERRAVHTDGPEQYRRPDIVGSSDHFHCSRHTCLFMEGKRNMRYKTNKLLTLAVLLLASISRARPLKRPRG